jgi:predicted Zn-dependent protease
MSLGRDDARTEELVNEALAAGLPDGEREYALTFQATTAPEAIQMLQRAVALDPYQRRARLDLAALLILSARLDEAAGRTRQILPQLLP